MGEDITFHKLFTSILLEECLVLDGPDQVVDHQAEDRENLFLCVFREMYEILVLINQTISSNREKKARETYPGPTVQHHPGHVHGSGSDMTLQILQESVVQKTDLHKVLGEGPRLEVVLVCLGNSPQEVHRIGVRQVVVQSREDEPFGTKNLFLSEAIVGDVAEVLNVRRENLLVLGGNEHRSHTDQLELIQHDDLVCQKPIDNVDGQEEGLREETEASVNLDEPIHKDTAHLPLEVDLVVHVVGVRLRFGFELPKVLEDLVDVLGDHQRVLGILGIEILPSFNFSGSLGLVDAWSLSSWPTGRLLNNLSLDRQSRITILGVFLLLLHFLGLRWSGPLLRSNYRRILLLGILSYRSLAGGGATRRLRDTIRRFGGRSGRRFGGRSGSSFRNLLDGSLFASGTVGFDLVDVADIAKGGTFTVCRSNSSSRVGGLRGKSGGGFLDDDDRGILTGSRQRRGLRSRKACVCCYCILIAVLVVRTPRACSTALTRRQVSHVCGKVWICCMFL